MSTPQSTHSSVDGHSPQVFPTLNKTVTHILVHIFSFPLGLHLVTELLGVKTSMYLTSVENAKQFFQSGTPMNNV